MTARLQELLQLREQVDREIDRERIRLGLSNLRSQPEADALATWAQDTLAMVGWFYGVNVDELTGLGRSRQVVLARHVTEWLLRQRGLSYPEIGRILGRDHASAIWGVARVYGDADLLATATGLLEDLQGAA